MGGDAGNFRRPQAAALGFGGCGGLLLVRRFPAAGAADCFCAVGVKTLDSRSTPLAERTNTISLCKIYSGERPRFIQMSDRFVQLQP